MPRPVDRYVALDAMRGVAALAVLAFHAQIKFAGHDISPAGYLAVDLFFVLSGFVIAHAYEHRLSADMGWPAFMRVRLIRLWPMAAAGVLLAAGLALFGHTRLTPSEVASSAVFGLALLPFPVDGSPLAFPLNSVLWSLAFEVLINLLYAVFFARLTRRVLMVVAGVSAAALVFHALATGNVNMGWRATDFLWGLCRVGFSFPVGVLLYRARDRFPAGLAKVGPWPLAGALGVLLVLPMGPLRQAFDLGFILLLSPALVVAGARMAKPSRLTNLLGDASYPLYALHYPIIATALAMSVSGPRMAAVCAGILVLAIAAERVDLSLRGWLLRVVPKPIRHFAAPDSPR